MKIKIGSHYVYQSSHISTTSGPKQGYSPLNVVAMCISQAIFGPFCSHYVYTFIIYHVVASTTDRRERARDVETRHEIWPLSSQFEPTESLNPLTQTLEREKVLSHYLSDLPMPMDSTLPHTHSERPKP